jgi:hypothetical protein
MVFQRLEKGVADPSKILAVAISATIALTPGVP